jgi:hypothetical protein
MHEFEVRILNGDWSPTRTMWLVYLNANAAITAARKAAEGMPFEVWRNDECIYATGDDHALHLPKRRSVL